MCIHIVYNKYIYIVIYIYTHSDFTILYTRVQYSFEVRDSTWLDPRVPILFNESVGAQKLCFFGHSQLTP